MEVSKFCVVIAEIVELGSSLCVSVDPLSSGEAISSLEPIVSGVACQELDLAGICNTVTAIQLVIARTSIEELLSSFVGSTDDVVAGLAHEDVMGVLVT